MDEDPDRLLTLGGEDFRMFNIDTPCLLGAAHRATILATAAISLGVIGGCGSTDPSSGTSGVASIQSPAPAAARAIASERPLVRNDASEEEKTRLRDVYIDCLWQNGFPKEGAVKGRNGGYPSDLEPFGLGPGVADRIRKACGSKEPELPIERAQRLDPDYLDHVRANVKCLNDHGIKAIIQDDKPALVDGLPGKSKGHWLDECEREAFKGYYSTLG